ncbi:MAG: hypothetical protein AAB036_07025, partial [Elusimicrobiota bacterium]
MVVISRDHDWLSRAGRLASGISGSFEALASVPRPGRPLSLDAALVVIDRGLAGGTPAKAIGVLRALYPSAAIALVFDEKDTGPDALSAAVSCGADDVIGKSWSDDAIAGRLGELSDKSISQRARTSPDGALKVDRRAQRALVLVQGRWKDAALDGGSFALLWRLMESPGERVTLTALRDCLAEALGRELEMATLRRRLAALGRSLSPWPGQLKAARGGFYR